MIEVSEEQIAEWAKERAEQEAELEAELRAFDEAETSNNRKWERRVAGGIIAFCGLAGAVFGHPLIGAGLGLITVAAIWIAGD